MLQGRGAANAKAGVASAPEGASAVMADSAASAASGSASEEGSKGTERRWTQDVHGDSEGAANNGSGRDLSGLQSSTGRGGSWRSANPAAFPGQRGDRTFTDRAPGHSRRECVFAAVHVVTLRCLECVLRLLRLLRTVLAAPVPLRAESTQQQHPLTTAAAHLFALPLQLL